MNHYSHHILLVAVSASLGMTAGRTLAVDWPHWLGPNTDNIAPASSGFNPDLSLWKTAWTAEVGKGYSSVIVADGSAFTMGHDGKGQETVMCFDAATGQVKWSHSYDAQLVDNMHAGGPSASPTVAGDKVITVSKDGQVLCLSKDDGKKIWEMHLLAVMDVKLPRWGVAGSPVVHGDLVLVSSGKVAALDLATGQTRWVSSESHYEGYTTPVVFRRGNQEYVASLDGKGLCVLSLEDGRELDRHPFKAQFDMVATTPFVLSEGSRIFISGNTSSEMVAFDGQKLSTAWTSKEIRNAMNNSVIFDGVLYGIDGKQKNSRSRLVAIDVADGKVHWIKEDFGYGNTIGVGDKILALTENGELVTAEAQADGYRELGRHKVLGDTCWTTPVYANGRIYVRNDQGKVVCLNAP